MILAVLSDVSQLPVIDSTAIQWLFACYRHDLSRNGKPRAFSIITRLTRSKIGALVPFPTIESQLVSNRCILVLGQVSLILVLVVSALLKLPSVFLVLYMIDLIWYTHKPG